MEISHHNIIHLWNIIDIKFFLIQFLASWKSSFSLKNIYADDELSCSKKERLGTEIRNNRINTTKY